MCGRFVLNADGKAIQQHFDLPETPMVQARYNIAPTQPVAVISNEDPMNLTHYRWGLIPSWAKDPSIASKMINARSETAFEKPSFKNAFKRRRCLIPSTGFYEWSKKGDSKVPYFVHMKGQELFAFAGLWESWTSKEGDEVRTCTILTSEPNELLRNYHHRMAVILDPSDYDLWLSKDELPTDVLMPLMRPFDETKMGVYEVSKLVNSVANDMPELIEPFSPPQQQLLI
ncbi:MAG: SOS response-associated peptidase [Aggregatilineales bacterium]